MQYGRLLMARWSGHVQEIGQCRGTLLAAHLEASMAWAKKFESDSLPISLKKGWRCTALSAKQLANVPLTEANEILSAFRQCYLFS